MARYPFTRQADGHKVVHELLLTRSPPGIGVSVTDRAASQSVVGGLG